MTSASLLKQIRGWIIFFIVALMISGITAFPVYTELKWITSSNMFSGYPVLSAWLNKVWEAVQTVQENFRFYFMVMTG